MCKTAAVPDVGTAAVRQYYFVDLVWQPPEGQFSQPHPQPPPRLRRRTSDQTATATAAATNAAITIVPKFSESHTGIRHTSFVYQAVCIICFCFLYGRKSIYSSSTRTATAQIKPTGCKAPVNAEPNWKIISEIA